MALTPNCKEINAKLRKYLSNENVTIPINIASNGFALKQVLSINALPSVLSIVPTNGNADVSGNVNVKVLALNEEKEYHVFEETVTFNVHLQDMDIVDGSKIYAMAKLLEVRSIVANENSVSFNVVVGLTSYLVKSQSFSYVESIDALAQQKTEVLEFSDITAQINQNFELSNEVNIPNNVSNILFINGNVSLDNCVAGTDIITLNGKVFASVVYLTNEDAPKLKSQEYTLDFNEEVLANGVTTDSQAVANVMLNNISYEVQGEMNSSKGILLVKATLGANVLACQKQPVERVVDAFCPRYSLNYETSNFLSQTNTLETMTEKVDGSLSLSDDVRIDKILCVSHTYTTHTITKLEQGIELNGVVYANVIYQLDDDTGTVGAILAELPFTKNLENVSGDVVDAVVSVREIEARSKRVKDIDIQADLGLTLNCSQNTNQAVISNVSLGEKLEENHKPLGVYIVNNVSELWDVAKSLRVSPETIMAQNPNLVFPITQPTNILIYRQRTQ